MANYPDNTRLSIISVKFGLDPMTSRNCVEIEWAKHDEAALSVHPQLNQRIRYQSMGVLTFPLEQLFDYELDLNEEEYVITEELEQMLYKVKKLAGRLVQMEKTMEFDTSEYEKEDEPKPTSF